MAISALHEFFQRRAVCRTASPETTGVRIGGRGLRQVRRHAFGNGDVYAAAELPEVPRTLRDGVELFAKSEFAIKAFGADVHEHFRHFFEVELAAYDNAVTYWERKRYFEQI